MKGLARMVLNPTTQLVDAATDTRGFIALNSGLETPVLQSLFSDRRARPSDDVEDRRGWWGDAHATLDGDQIGSHLWLLKRQPRSPQNLRRAQVFSTECLAWMQRIGIAKSVTVTVEPHDDDITLYHVSIERPDGTTWSGVWDQHGNEVDRAL